MKTNVSYSKNEGKASVLNETEDEVIPATGGGGVKRKWEHTRNGCKWGTIIKLISDLLSTPFVVVVLDF